MNGYVKNRSISWIHCMKRAVGPGAKVSLDSLYKQYGKKHDLAKGEEFIQWLRSVKLKNKDVWEIVFTENVEVEDVEEKIEDEDVEEIKSVNVVEITKSKTEDRSTNVIRKMTVQDIVKLTVRPAREIIPLIQDVNLLKYSLQEANQMAGKDSLCQIIRRRIDTMSRIG